MWCLLPSPFPLLSFFSLVKQNESIMNESQSAHVNLALAHLEGGGVGILGLVNYGWHKHFYCTISDVEVQDRLENLLTSYLT